MQWSAEADGHTEEILWETQQWSADEDGPTEEIQWEIQETCDADLGLQTQLETDIRAVRTLYSDSAVSVRAYGAIDDVDVDLNVNANFISEEVADAWGIDPSEPIVIRLHFSLSQYLDGPAPSVEVFQRSNADHFRVGKQLQNVLQVFISQEWDHVTNENVVVQQKRRHSWFRPRGTITKCRARLNIWLQTATSNKTHEPSVRGRIMLSAKKRNPFAHHKTTYTIKNPAGELFTYTPNGKKVAVSAVRSSAQISSKQLMELLFSSRAIRHCKSSPSLQHGFLVQIMKYAEQRLPTLNEHCVICDQRHVLQNGPMLKPAVCTRELCVFSFHTLGVMSGATEEVATGAEVVDLLVALCRAALQSSRKSIIFEPYPSVVDPRHPETLAFSPRRKSYDRLQKAMDNVLSLRRMAQGPQAEFRRQMQKLDPLAYPLLHWILTSNRSHIVKLPLHRQLEFMHTPHQFLLVSSPPSKEARFQAARDIYGSAFAFHGSHIENWHSILRNGLVNASYTKLQLHGAAYGKGIYLSPISSISFEYSEMGKSRHQISSKEELLKKHNRINKIQEEQPGRARFLQSNNINCIALCEVITSKALQKHGSIWVCPVPDHVCTRFLFVYEDGRVGDAHVDTQEAHVQREILQVIASRTC